MNSVTTMIEQLGWQKLEHRRDNSRLCLLFKIMQHQIHVPINDILSQAPITAMRLFHERNLLVPYARTDIRTYINTHTRLLCGTNYQTRLKKLNLWILFKLKFDNYVY